jgi:hypothetical protein
LAPGTHERVSFVDTALAAAIETVDDFSLACAAVAEHWLVWFAVLALGDAS